MNNNTTQIDAIQRAKEYTKALQDGKTLISVSGQHTVKMINGILVMFFEGSEPTINERVDLSNDWEIQEPPQPFKITECTLAEYESRDGRRAICNGEQTEQHHRFYYCVFYTDGSRIYVDINGHSTNNGECNDDLVRKIRNI